MKNRLVGLAVAALAASTAFAAQYKSVEDVMDYGAVGDGRTDDTAAILKAEAAAWASGKPLFFPTNDVGSTYLTRKGVILVSGMTLTADKGAVLANASAVLEGGGQTLRIRLFRPAKKGDTVLYLTNVDGLKVGQEVTIYNDSSSSWGYSETLADIASVDSAANAVTIDTSRYADDGKNLGMRSDMPAGTGSVLTDFALVKTVQRRGRDAENVIVENITVRPYGNPNDPYIYTISPIAQTAQNRPAKQWNFTVRGVTVDGSMHDGISTQGAGDIWIENCTVRNVKHKGIHWGTSCDRVIIRGNLCEDCGSPEFEKVSNNGGTGGMYFCYNNHRMIIENNVMRRCFKGVFGYDGREVGGSDTDSIVASNLFDDCTQCGLQLMGGFHLTATGNRFVNFTGDAVPILSVKEWKGLQYSIVSDNVAENFQDGYNAAHEPIDLTQTVGTVARNNKVKVKGEGEGVKVKGEGVKVKSTGIDKRSFLKKEAFAADFDFSRDWYAEFVQRLDLTEDANVIASFAGVTFRFLRGPVQAFWSAGGATRYIYSQRLPNADLRWPASEPHHFLVTSTNRVIRAYVDGRLVFTQDYSDNYAKHPYEKPANSPRLASVQLRHDVRLFRVGYLAAGTDPGKLVAERFNGGRPLAWTGKEPERLFELRESEINPEGVVKPDCDPYAEKVSGEGALRRAPRFAGQRYRDAKAGREYVAKGNALPCDWKPGFKDKTPKAKGPHMRPEFVNPYEVVTAYGAVGDGTNDDSQAIAKAVAAAAKSGKPVYFPKTGNGSVYSVSTSVVVGKGIRVLAHPGAVIRSATTALTVRGNGVTVENLVFASQANDAVVVEKSEKVSFRHVLIDGAGANGLVLKDCEDVTVEDSIIRGAARAGVRLEGGCEKTTLLGNHIVDCGFTGNGKKRTTVADGGCVEFAGAEETILKCNHFGDSANGVYGGGDEDEEAEIVHNTFNNLALAGVALGGGEKMRFYGNRFLRFGGTAVPFKAVAAGKGKPLRESVIEANGFASFEAAMSPNGKRKNESAYVNAEGAIVLDGVKDVRVVGNSLRKDTILAKEAVAAEASVEIKVVNSSGVKTEDNLIR